MYQEENSEQHEHEENSQEYDKVARGKLFPSVLLMVFEGEH